MKQNNSIIRVQKDKENPYVMMNKTFLEDSRISFKAKGILAYLLSKPDNWQVRVADLVKQSTDGERAVYSGLRELKQFGYLQKKPVYQNGKIHHWESVVFELPTYPKNLYVENSKEVGNSNFIENDNRQNLLVENLLVENLNVENGERNNKLLLINNDLEINNQLVSLEEPMEEEGTLKDDELTNIYQKSNIELFESEPLKNILKETIKELYNDTNTRAKVKQIEVEHIDTAISKYRQAQEQKEIKNPKLYFKRCILSAIEESGLKNLL